MPFEPAPEPKTPLGYHRILSPQAGVRVSPLCLGGMNFGDAWADAMGPCDKTTTFEILDYFFKSGGNFIDTANNYQDGQSEEWIGDWMQERKNRDQIVLATKFTNPFPRGKQILVNYQGNHKKSLRASLEASLSKLKTDYVDLLYLHYWDFSTSVSEVMQSLHQLVLSGKVLYLGISDTPAWIVSKANEYARRTGLTPFSVYQGRWSAADRDLERDVIPMVQDEGMALAPWGALGSGNFRVEEEGKKEGRTMVPQSENARKVSRVLQKIAETKGGVHLTSVALAYVIHKQPYVFPIVGGRKLEHLNANIRALTIRLTEQEIDEIEAAVPFDVGFPMNFLFEFRGQQKYNNRMSTADIGLVRMAGRVDSVSKPQPIAPRTMPEIYNTSNEI